MNDEQIFWPAYLIGATLAGTPFFGALTWLVGKFAFRKRTALDRARLLPAAIWLVLSVLWVMRGTWLYSLTTLPSFLIVAGIMHYWAKRADRKNIAP